MNATHLKTACSVQFARCVNTVKLGGPALALIFTTILTAAPLSALAQMQMPSAPVTKEQLLSQLNDVATPEAVSWWPLSLGWWLLLLFIAAAIATGLAVFLNRRNKVAYRRKASALLESIPENADISTNDYANQVMVVLKRCFFAAYPHSKHLSAKLHGNDWAQYLNLTLAKPKESKINWSDILYGKGEAQQSKKDLKRFAKDWIQHHRELSISELSDIHEKLLTDKQGANHV